MSKEVVMNQLMPSLLRLVFIAGLNFVFICASWGKTANLWTASEVELVAKKINSEIVSMQGALYFLKTNNQKKAVELEAFLSKNSQLKKLEFPRIIQDGGSLSFVIEGVKYNLNLLSDGKMALSFKNHELLLNRQMSLDEMNKMISLEMNKAQVSVFSYLIPESHASMFGALIITGVSILAYSIYDWYKGQNFNAMVNNFDDLCKRFKDSEQGRSDLDELKNAYNNLSDEFLRECAPRGILYAREYDKEMCEKRVPAIKSCLRKLIKDRSLIDDSSRKNKKELQYEPVKDKYLPASKVISISH